MQGSKWLQECPDSLVEAQEYILETPGESCLVSFMPMQVKSGDHEGVLFIASQPFAVGDVDDYVIVSVTADTAQLLADRYHCLLPTTKIVDLLHEAATQEQSPHTQPANDRMATKAAMQEHSEDVQFAVGGKYPGLADNCGKHWVLTNRLNNKPEGTAANYGWYDPKAPYVSASGYRMWQTLGTRHNTAHVDSSQTLTLVVDEMIVDGQVRSTRDVLADPELCGLLSSEGVLTFLRYPTSEPEPPPDPKPDEPQLTYERTLYLTSPRVTGDDVIEWQAFCVSQGYDLGPYGPSGNGVDGSFGGLTDAATRQFQASTNDPMTGQNLVVDGKVGPVTIRAANVALGAYTGPKHHDPEPPRDQKLITDYKQAKNYTPVADSQPRDIKWVVIHTAEMPEKPTSAEALGAWVSGPHAPRSSWHFAVDADSIVQSVKVKDVAWHAPGANRHGIGIEHAGYARQSAKEWRDEFSESMLRRSARLAAKLCKDHGIPVQYVDQEGLQRGDRGITTHHAVSIAFRKSDHTDPGDHFPMEWFLDLVRQEIG